MRAIHVEVKGEYGWPRIHKELLARLIRAGKERVRRLTQRHGLPVAPDLVQRRFIPEAPSQLWSGDITHIATDER